MVAIAKANEDLVKKILDLAAQGIPKKDMPAILRVGKTTIFKTLKMYRVPDEPISMRLPKKIANINDLISIHLLCNCEDLEVLSKRLAMEIIEQKPEKIIVPTRLQKIIKKEKISKITSILDRVNLKYNLEFAIN